MADDRDEQGCGRRWRRRAADCADCGSPDACDACELVAGLGDCGPSLTLLLTGLVTLGAALAAPRVTARTLRERRPGDPPGAAGLLVAVVRVYQRQVSSCLPARCPSSPTCSGYAVRALQESGLRQGTARAWRRLRSCRAPSRLRHTVQGSGA